MTSAAALLALTLAGCAVQRPPMSAAEVESTRTRQYPGSSAQQVRDAATRLWRLSDGDKYLIQTESGGLVATRKWTSYSQMVAFAGTDTWRLEVTESDGVATARIALSTVKRMTSASLLGMTPATNTGPNVGGSVAGTAIYDIFWARMDYLLGTRTEWMTCTAADARVSAGITWGTNEALCSGFDVKDAAP